MQLAILIQKSWASLRSRCASRTSSAPAVRPGFPGDLLRCDVGNGLLIGDAAGYEEPFTGEGIGLALLSGTLAAEAILESGRRRSGGTMCARMRQHGTSRPCDAFAGWAACCAIRLLWQLSRHADGSSRWPRCAASLDRVHMRRPCMSHDGERPNCYVQAIGTVVPEPSLPTGQAAERLEDSCINDRSRKLLRRLSRLTSIRKRHMSAMDYQLTLHDEDGPFRPAAEQPHGPGMSERTRMYREASDRLVRHALARLPEERLRQVSTLVTATCTDASSPGLEQPVFEHSPVSPTVDRWNVGFMGCSAALAALRLVHRIREPDRVTLSVTCELSSLHYQYTDQLDQMTANLLFADGASAMVLSSEPSSLQVVDASCAHVPSHAGQMVWEAGDHGMTLVLSPKLPETLAEHLPAALGRLLERNGWSSGDVAHWLVHPGGPQILDSVERTLSLPQDALTLSRDVLSEFGNMSSSTIVFILERLRQRGATGRAVAMAFGPGLTIELVLLELS